MRVNGLFLTAYPFADQIIAAVRDNMPDLAQYQPADVFEAIGLSVVVFNIYQRTRTTQSLHKKGSK